MFIMNVTHNKYKECKDKYFNRNTKGTRRRHKSYKFKLNYHKHGRFNDSKVAKEQGFNKNMQNNLRTARKHKKIQENKQMRYHINFFKQSIDSIPDKILVHILNISDYSTPFYYENFKDNSKQIIFVTAGGYNDSGAPRFVFINKYDIVKDSFDKIASFSCNSYSKSCPTVALQQ
eukprot:871914_1